MECIWGPYGLVHAHARTHTPTQCLCFGISAILTITKRMCGKGVIFLLLSKEMSHYQMFSPFILYKTRICDYPFFPFQATSAVIFQSLSVQVAAHRCYLHKKSHVGGVAHGRSQQWLPWRKKICMLITPLHGNSHCSLPWTAPVQQLTWIYPEKNISLFHLCRHVHFYVYRYS